MGHAKSKIWNLWAYIKANRKGSRDAELEDSTGFKSVNKVHKSKKTYTRKQKHRDDEMV